MTATITRTPDANPYQQAAAAMRAVPEKIASLPARINQKMQSIARASAKSKPVIYNEFD